MAERVIRDWIDFYITEHPHSALDGQTPEDAYWADRRVGMMERLVGLPTSARVPQQQKAINTSDFCGMTCLREAHLSERRKVGNRNTSQAIQRN